jgi:hypothetical protein
MEHPPSPPWGVHARIIRASLVSQYQRILDLITQSRCGPGSGGQVTFPDKYNQIRDTVQYTALFHGLGGEVCDVISGKARWTLMFDLLPGRFRARFLRPSR